jgi:hypothetical protein
MWKNKWVSLNKWRVAPAWLFLCGEFVFRWRVDIVRLHLCVPPTRQNGPVSTTVFRCAVVVRCGSCCNGLSLRDPKDAVLLLNWNVAAVLHQSGPNLPHQNGHRCWRSPLRRPSFGNQAFRHQKTNNSMKTGPNGAKSRLQAALWAEQVKRVSLEWA